MALELLHLEREVLAVAEQGIHQELQRLAQQTLVVAVVEVILVMPELTAAPALLSSSTP